eukprot:snap_masked-scaffold_34-processed-gene-2.24-mRNA-1 protein AED:1.00 eAED:1.00 QI:0/-1/0/0/-1/1/1/0/2055
MYRSEFKMYEELFKNLKIRCFDDTINAVLGVLNTELSPENALKIFCLSNQSSVLPYGEKQLLEIVFGDVLELVLTFTEHINIKNFQCLEINLNQLQEKVNIDSKKLKTTIYVAYKLSFSKLLQIILLASTESSKEIVLKEKDRFLKIINESIISLYEILLEVLDSEWLLFHLTTNAIVNFSELCGIKQFLDFDEGFGEFSEANLQKEKTLIDIKRSFLAVLPSVNMLSSFKCFSVHSTADHNGKILDKTIALLIRNEKRFKKQKHLLLYNFLLQFLLRSKASYYYKCRIQKDDPNFLSAKEVSLNMKTCIKMMKQVSDPNSRSYLLLLYFVLGYPSTPKDGNEMKSFLKNLGTCVQNSLNDEKHTAATLYQVLNFLELYKSLHMEIMKMFLKLIFFKCAKKTLNGSIMDPLFGLQNSFYNKDVGSNILPYSTEDKIVVVDSNLSLCLEILSKAVKISAKETLNVFVSGLNSSANREIKAITKPLEYAIECNRLWTFFIAFFKYLQTSASVDGKILESIYNFLQIYWTMLRKFKFDFTAQAELLYLHNTKENLFEGLYLYHGNLAVKNIVPSTFLLKDSWKRWCSGEQNLKVKPKFKVQLRKREKTSSTSFTKEEESEHKSKILRSYLEMLLFSTSSIAYKESLNLFCTHDPDFSKLVEVYFGQNIPSDYKNRILKGLTVMGIEKLRQIRILSSRSQEGDIIRYVKQLTRYLDAWVQFNQNNELEVHKVVSSEALENLLEFLLIAFLFPSRAISKEIGVLAYQLLHLLTPTQTKEHFLFELFAAPRDLADDRASSPIKSNQAKLRPDKESNQREKLFLEKYLHMVSHIYQYLTKNASPVFERVVKDIEEYKKVCGQLPIFNPSEGDMELNLERKETKSGMKKTYQLEQITKANLTYLATGASTLEQVLFGCFDAKLELERLKLYFDQFPEVSDYFVARNIYEERNSDGSLFFFSDSHDFLLNLLTKLPVIITNTDQLENFLLLIEKWLKTKETVLRNGLPQMGTGLKIRDKKGKVKQEVLTTGINKITPNMLQVRIADIIYSLAISSLSNVLNRFSNSATESALVSIIRLHRYLSEKGIQQEKSVETFLAVTSNMASIIVKQNKSHLWPIIDRKTVWRTLTKLYGFSVDGHIELIAKKEVIQNCMIDVLTVGRVYPPLGFRNAVEENTKTFQNGKILEEFLYTHLNEGKFIMEDINLIAGIIASLNLTLAKTVEGSQVRQNIVEVLVGLLSSFKRKNKLFTSTQGLHPTENLVYSQGCVLFLYFHALSVLEHPGIFSAMSFFLRSLLKLDKLRIYTQVVSLSDSSLLETGMLQLSKSCAESSVFVAENGDSTSQRTFLYAFIMEYFTVLQLYPISSFGKLSRLHDVCSPWISSLLALDCTDIFVNLLSTLWETVKSVFSQEITDTSNARTYFCKVLNLLCHDPRNCQTILDFFLNKVVFADKWTSLARSLFLSATDVLYMVNPDAYVTSFTHHLKNSVFDMFSQEVMKEERFETFKYFMDLFSSCFCNSPEPFAKLFVEVYVTFLVFPFTASPPQVGYLNAFQELVRALSFKYGAKPFNAISAGLVEENLPKPVDVYILVQNEHERFTKQNSNSFSQLKMGSSKSLIRLYCLIAESLPDINLGTLLLLLTSVAVKLENNAIATRRIIDLLNTTAEFCSVEKKFLPERSIVKCIFMSSLSMQQGQNIKALLSCLSSYWIFFSRETRELVYYCCCIYFERVLFGEKLFSSPMKLNLLSHFNEVILLVWSNADFPMIPSVCSSFVHNDLTLSFEAYCSGNFEQLRQLSSMPWEIFSSEQILKIRSLYIIVIWVAVQHSVQLKKLGVLLETKDEILPNGLKQVIHADYYDFMENIGVHFAEKEYAKVIVYLKILVSDVCRASSGAQLGWLSSFIIGAIRKERKNFEKATDIRRRLMYSSLNLFSAASHDILPLPTFKDSGLEMPVCGSSTCLDPIQRFCQTTQLELLKVVYHPQDICSSPLFQEIPQEPELIFSVKDKYENLLKFLLSGKNSQVVDEDASLYQDFIQFLRRFEVKRVKKYRYPYVEELIEVLESKNIFVG